MTDPARADLIARLLGQAAIRDEFNKKLRDGGSPREPLPFIAMALCAEAADALAEAEAIASSYEMQITGARKETGVSIYDSRPLSLHIAGAVAQARKAALEEAARVADIWTNTKPTEGPHAPLIATVYCDAGKRIADAIRALGKGERG